MTDINLSVNSDSDEDNMNVVDETSVDENSDSSNGNETVGLSPWANAMSRVLNVQVTKNKKFILSKAKRDSEIKPNQLKEIEVIDSSGNTIKQKKSVDENLNDKRKQSLEKRKKKILWEAMCRVKPDLTNREKERELVRIATKGIVHLFNTVEKHQKSKVNADKDPKKKNKLNIVKGNFMDILKGRSKMDIKAKADPVKNSKDETWKILKDDFMMGAEMKDWDRESEGDV